MESKYRCSKCRDTGYIEMTDYHWVPYKSKLCDCSLHRLKGSFTTDAVCNGNEDQETGETE
jgi:hypothetical protein